MPSLPWIIMVVCAASYMDFPSYSRIVSAHLSTELTHFSSFQPNCSVCTYDTIKTLSHVYFTLKIAFVSFSYFNALSEVSS